MNEFSNYEKENNSILGFDHIFFISILPIGLIAGSLISNTIIILICIFFLYDLSIKKNFFYLNKFNFYFLIIINIYLFLNSFFISENNEKVGQGLSGYSYSEVEKIKRCKSNEIEEKLGHPGRVALIHIDDLVLS